MPPELSINSICFLFFCFFWSNEKTALGPYAMTSSYIFSHQVQFNPYSETALLHNLQKKAADLKSTQQLYFRNLDVVRCHPLYCLMSNLDVIPDEEIFANNGPFC